MSVSITFTVDEFRTARRRERGHKSFRAEAEAVEISGKLWARWSPETARLYDPAFDGWTVERALFDPDLGDSDAKAWAGFPARLTRDDVTITLQRDGKGTVEPFSATGRDDVQAATRAIREGSPLTGRPKAKRDAQVQAVYAEVCAWRDEHGSDPRLLDIAVRLGRASDDGTGRWFPRSAFRKMVSEHMGGWAQVLRDA